MTPPGVNTRADDVDAATIYINVEPDAYCSLTHGRGSPVKNGSVPPLVAADIYACIRVSRVLSVSHPSSPSRYLFLFPSLSLGKPPARSLARRRWRNGHSRRGAKKRSALARVLRGDTKRPSFRMLKRTRDHIRSRVQIISSYACINNFIRLNLQSARIEARAFAVYKY